MTNEDLKIDAVTFVHKKAEDMLAISGITENTNLIEAGLSSIMIMQISNHLRKYGLKIPFSGLIEKPTLGEWAQMIHSSGVSQGRKQQVTAKITENSEFDLTDVQYAYFVGRDDEQPLGGVGCHAYLEIDGERGDGERLKKAWNTILDYHPMLRAKFLETGKQIIMPTPYSREMGVYDFSRLPKNAAEKELLALREELSHRKLKVEKGEVAGLSLALLPCEKTRMFLDVDLLVADVSSLGILLQHLAEAYTGKEFIRQSTYTFQDYMENRKNEISDREFNEDRKFWENKISGLNCEIPGIPLAKKPELISETRFSRRQCIIDKEAWSEIRRVASGYKATPSMCLLTCYALILERWCNQASFLINIPLFNRDTENEEIRNMVADFTNLLLLDFHRKGNEAFIDTLHRVRGTFLENVAHSHYSGVNVQRDIFKTMGSAGFVAPVVFACNIDSPLETGLSREVFGDISYMVSQTPQVWLDFQTYVRDGALILCWDAVDELFPEGMLEDMFNALVDLVKKLAAADNWNAVFDVLPQRQLEQRKAELDGILPVSYPRKSLITDFLKNAQSKPGNVAVIDGISKKEISYGHLYSKAMAIAGLLVKAGIKQGDYIGITLPRGCGQIYAMLGILFSGGVYVPIGVNQPEDRRKKILRQTGINYIVSDTGTIRDCSLYGEEIRIINLDEAEERISLEKPVPVSPESSAYVIMTSGSTGVPKGVEISHGSAVNTIEDINRRYGITSEDTVLMVSAIDFDLSVYDVFGMLSCGGRLVVLDEAGSREPALWLSLMEQYSISIWNSVPMLFDMLVTMAEGKGRKLNIRVAMLSGDWIALDLPSRFYNRSENSVVAAMGGATEASVWSNYLIVPREIPSAWVSIPYGNPLGNQIYRVMDDLGRICPEYVQGELRIGGAGVAKGYRGDEELTREKFITDTIRWYKTGDAGRIWKDGTIEFLGRKDNQVKIKGYRIEIGEIESALKKNPRIADAVVCVVKRAGGSRLAAYVVLKEKMEPGGEALKSALEKLLPGYMIPETYYFSGRIPLLENGKPDKREIQRLLNEHTDTETYVPPQNPLEIQIGEIWKEVLNRERLSRFDNFFTLGGDSLKAVAIVTRIEAIFDDPVNISVRILFKAPTIHAFALEIDKLNSDFEVEAI
ncbi:phenyloxazoline synthase MbtB [Ruminiclostridium hungatei]|uniref:Phenyloxazoline synthase MbtB n=1 Tax=Ruminiclostridium hungatei TaxID=48256 RepID=A0A1V4SM22_RUMHU|nr:non-ribosomal peptide synthetase [Ruminiclostridium hungatei]OPX44929.1 phenyloxazoline synthase MbtB [Ruminiclostridium hungatei]